MRPNRLRLHPRETALITMHLNLITMIIPLVHRFIREIHSFTVGDPNNEAENSLIFEKTSLFTTILHARVYRSSVFFEKTSLNRPRYLDPPLYYIKFHLRKVTNIVISRRRIHAKWWRPTLLAR